MNTQQTIAAAAGAGLIGVNYWTGTQRKAVTAGALTSSASKAKEAAAHSAIAQLAGELLFVGVAVLLAGAGGHAGNTVVAAFAALWLLWLIKHYAKGS